QRGTEGGDQVGGQVGNEANGIGQDHQRSMRKHDPAQRRIKRREQHVLGHHGRAGQAVEQRRLASIGVAYKRNDRKRHLTALGSVQVACTSNCLKLPLDARDAVLQQTTVGFDLGFTRAAHEAATATLAFQVSPTANETTALVFEMRKIDLKAAFLGAGAAAKDLQDETSAIKHLGLQLALQIALLNRRKLMIHDHQLGLRVFNDASNFG